MALKSPGPFVLPFSFTLMELYFYSIIIFLQLGMVFLFFIFKNTAPSYLKKKAEDLATIQDIGRITNEVKSVENEFSKKLSIFQADLNIIKSHSQKLGDEERELLIRLYQACNKVVFSLKQIKFKPATSYELTEIENEVAKWTSCVELLIEIRSNCELFITDSELRANAISFVDHSLGFTDEIKLFFSFFYRQLEKIKGYEDSIKAMERAIKKSISPDSSKFDKNEYSNRIQGNILIKFGEIEKVMEVKDDRINLLLSKNQEHKGEYIKSFKKFYKISETVV